MAIKKLLKLIKTVNIADTIAKKQGGENELMMIGQDVIKGFDVDWASMDEWKEDIDKGLELIKPAKGSRSEPWQGAANHKTPLLIEARIKFGDRASEELLATSNLVKAKVIGKDPDDAKADRVERVETVMNWQLTVEAASWVEEQEKLLYNVADQGHIFKKTLFDASLGHNVSEVISYPNFAINQATKTLDSALRFTQKVFKTPNEIVEMINSGIWRDIDIEFGALSTSNDDSIEKTASEDDLTEFFEQQTLLDLDGDGYQEPYIVTVHAASGTVMRIKSQISLDGIFVRDDDGVTLSVDKLILKDENGDFVLDENEEIQLIEPEKKRIIVKISRDENLVSYSFLTNPQSEFLSVGYFHLLGSYAQGINTTTNQLLDAGTLANLQTGWLAKGFRKKMGDMKMGPGTWHQTNLSAQELQTGILPVPFKEPSGTLLNLNQGLMNEAQRLSSTTDLGSVLGTNTPAATTLSLVHEQQQSVGAIILRMYRSMCKEFAIWYRLNAKFMDPEQYMILVDDQEANPFVDFNTQDMDIVPSANPRNSSKIQRIQKAQAELSVMPQIEQTGGNAKEVVESYLEAIGSENLEQIYPELTEEQQVAAQKEQERQKQLQEMQVVVPLEAQAALGRAEELKAKARVLEAQANLMKTQAETGLTIAKTGTERAKTELTIEKAETEATKNATSIVGTELDIEKAKREAELVNIDRGQNNGNNPEPNTGMV
ncbi:MAG: hypothetical protein E2O80_00375 [Betaproteobacteria bacterium]|nr:MAG: hypothetical protein E2O80_00375 [Betaproteobacteria bacterium]